MHKSKLSGFIIDCRTTDLERAADFWGNALGMRVHDLPPGEGEIYKRLEDNQHGLHIEVQTVSHSSRVHLDIETNDIEAEVRFALALDVVLLPIDDTFDIAQQNMIKIC